MKYPVGPQTRKKAAQTQPGKLAALLNHVLYSADTHKVHVTEHVAVERWVAEKMFFIGDDPLPEGLSSPEGAESYCETEALMRAIRDYLEFRSFEEVIP